MEGDDSSRRFLSWLWTPLVIVTSAAGGRRSGQVAVSAIGASIVPDRPRLSVALWKGNFTRELVEQSGAFAVHVLGDTQDNLVYQFGLQSGRDADKFAGVSYEVGATGVPLLRDCLAVFECRVIRRTDGGDHTSFLGDVVNALLRADGSPLWWRDLRARMPEERRAEWEAKSAADMRLAAATMDHL